MPFANSGAKQPIPVDSQVGIEDGRASYTDGFPPLTRTPLAAGGKPPFGTDMNGILNAITAIQQWQSAGGMFMYDADLSASIGGYPKGAFILKADASGLWQSSVENNTSNPDTGGAGWSDFSIATLGVPAGAIQAFAMNSAPNGWIAANGAAVSRTTYSRLFAAIGTTYGAGDGSTTFGVPELRGEFVRGVDNGRGINPTQAFGALALDALQTHDHDLPTTSGDTEFPAPAIPDATFQVNTTPNSSVSPGQIAKTIGGVSTPARSAGETRPRSIALLYCIKT